MRRNVLVGMLLICVTILFLGVFISSVSAYTLYVPDSHSAIQEAVDAANAGDTIIVRGGTYVGDVYVNKSLTIRSESGAEKTFVYGSFIITSDHVKIRGFEIEWYIVTPPIGFEKQGFHNIGEHTLPKILGNPPSHIEILENFVKQMIIVNGVCNNISNNSCNQIYLAGKNSTISNNKGMFKTYKNIFGDDAYSFPNLFICLNGWNNTVSNNKVDEIYADGWANFFANNECNESIEVAGWRNVVVNNTINCSGAPIVNGIKLSGFGIRDVPFYFYYDSSPFLKYNLTNYVHNYGIGRRSCNNTIVNNVIIGSGQAAGIDLVGCNNTICNNTIAEFSCGITLGDHLSESKDNIIYVNNIFSSKWPISVAMKSNHNIVYLNNFRGTRKYGLILLSSPVSRNLWNSPEKISYTYKGKRYTNYLGNYWSEYSPSKHYTQEDGIGDIPYIINSDKDNYPLMEGFENYIDEVEEPTEFLVAVSNPAGAYICNDDVDFTFDRNLKRGDSGDDVKYLQIVLNANPATQVAVEGPGSPCHEANYFGELTEAAVIKFQTLHEGLTQTGEIDEATRAELNKLYLPVKHVPNGWVLNVTNTAQNEEIHDGCLWWEVEDVTDGIKGWVAYQKLSDATNYLVIGDQEGLNDKIKKLNTKEDRISVILHAVMEHRTEFLPDNFPLGLILAMAIQESGRAGFDNEIVALTPWGRGIMQIDTPDYYVGAGSGIRWYNNGAVDYCRGKEGHGCTCSAGICYCDACKHYYTNTTQGIEANIRDGLYALRDKYNCQCCYDRGKDAEWDAEEGLYREEMGGEVIFYSREEECKGSDGQTYDSGIEKIKIGGVQITCNEFKVIDAVWRYNGRSIYPEGSCMGNDYLRCVADRLNEIECIFGYEMPDKDAWITCLKAVSSSASVMKRIK